MRSVFLPERRTYLLLPFLAGLAPAMLVAINVISGAKIVELGPFNLGVFMLPAFALAGGTVLFPITYVFDDVVTEVYGMRNATRVIMTSALALLFCIFATWLVGRLPQASFYSPEEAEANQLAYTRLLSIVPLINFASITAIVFGRLANSWVLHRMKKRFGEHYTAVGLRFVASTVAGELVDTALFLGIAFGWTRAPSELVFMFVSQFVFKVVWEVIALPITLPLTSWIKRLEGIGVETDTTAEREAGALLCGVEQPA